MHCLRKAHAFLLMIAVLTILCVFSLRQRAYAMSGDASYNTMAIENMLEEKLRSVFTEIIGSDSVIVLVNAEVKTIEGDARKQDAVLLPGVPKKKEEGSEANLLKMSAGRLSIKRLGISVLVDTGVSEATRELILEVAAKAVGFSKSRGDELTIKQVKFGNKRFSLSSFLYPPNLYLFPLSLIAAFFMVTAGLFLRNNPFNKLGEALKGVASGNDKEKEEGSSWKDLGLQTVMDAATAGGGSAEPQQGGLVLPFSFVRERDISNLVFLLKDKSSQEVSVVINYLGPELAGKLLAHFPEDKQIEIAASLGTIDINPGKTRALEEKIKESLEFVVGGEQKVAALLETADESVREKIIARIEKKDAEAARRLRLQLRDFEAYLRDMSASGISLLYRQAEAAVFAQLLKTTPDEVQQKVFGALSAGAVERLKQEINLSRPLSPARIRKEKQNMTAVIRRLIKDGAVEVENN